MIGFSVATIRSRITFIGTGEHTDDFVPFKTKYLLVNKGIGDIEDVFENVNHIKRWVSAKKSFHQSIK